MRLVNARTEQPVAVALEVADTRATRRRGLLGRDGLAAGSALMLTPCNAVHTVGMRFAIDIVFVDSRASGRWRPQPSAMADGGVAPLACDDPTGCSEIGGDMLHVSATALYLAPESGEAR